MKLIKGTLGALLINNRIIYIFLCCMALINVMPLPFFGIGTGYAEPVFSITSDNEHLYEVMAKIYKSTGYKIEITKGWEDKTLTANLKKITLEKGLREIMRLVGESNYALVVNDSMKKVEIRIFDTSLPGQKKGGGVYVGTKADFHKREKAAAERELMEMDMGTAGKPEEPMEIDMAPTEIEITNPDQ
jgi:hypothetical protein